MQRLTGTFSCDLNLAQTQVIARWLGLSRAPGGVAATCRLESPSTERAAGKGKRQPPTAAPAGWQGPPSLLHVGDWRLGSLGTVKL